MGKLSRGCLGFLNPFTLKTEKKRNADTWEPTVMFECEALAGFPETKDALRAEPARPIDLERVHARQHWHTCTHARIVTIWKRGMKVFCRIHTKIYTTAKQPATHNGATCFKWELRALVCIKKQTKKMTLLCYSKQPWHVMRLNTGHHGFHFTKWASYCIKVFFFFNIFCY